MGDTNLIGGIVRILEAPKQQIFTTNITVTRCRVQFPQLRNTAVIHLTFWGTLARDVANYYKINDYVLIEGYISLRDKNINAGLVSKSKKIEITVLKIYPLFLSYDLPSIQN